VDKHDLAQRLDLAKLVAEQAGALALQHFQSPDLTVESKGDAGPVTNADRACESLIRTAINRAFPHDAILGEEQGESTGTSGYRWLIDPIDGTVSFARGVPLFGVLIGIERDEPAGPRVVAGVCHMPALGERLFASEGTDATWQRAGRPPAQARVSTCQHLAGALLCTTSPDYYRQTNRLDAMNRLTAAAHRVRGYSDCYGLLLCATGRVDVFVDPLMNPWDNGPFPIIFERAGGTFCGWDGAAGARVRDCIAGTSALVEQVRTVLHL
jgi:histidinol phosphatase-like enzyme (inositol monophosphatase family)